MDVVLLETFTSKEMLKALNKRAEEQAAAAASWNVAGDGQMADQGGKMLQAQEDWLQDTIRTLAKGIKEIEPATTVGNRQAKTSSSGPRKPGFSFLSANPFRSAVKNLYSFVTKPFRPGFCREARSSKNYHTLENCYSPKRCSHPQIHDVCMKQGYVSPFADLFVLFRTGNGCRAVRNVNVVDTATRGAAVDKFARSCVPLRHYCALQDLFETSRGRENRGLRRNIFQANVEHMPGLQELGRWARTSTFRVSYLISMRQQLILMSIGFGYSTGDAH
eukprot:g7353.t1